jgi:hypothetical protein
VDPELPHCVHKQNPHQHTFPFASAAQNNIPKQKTKKRALRKPVRLLLAEPASE